jgi:hypothetical protein
MFTKAAILSSMLLLVFAYFGIERLVEYCFTPGFPSYTIAAIILMLCISFIHRSQFRQ